MLQKKYRLKKYSALTATYKVNNTTFDSNVCIYFGKEKTTPELDTKFAFVVSKKIHKRAVVRNRIKRLMRESIRLLIKNSRIDNLNKYLSIIVKANRGAIGADFNQINNSIINLISTK